MKSKKSLVIGVALLCLLGILLSSCDIFAIPEPIVTPTIEPTQEPIPTPTPVPLFKTDSFEYLKHEDHIELVKYIGTDLFVTMPDYIDFLPVTHIGDEAFAGTNVTYVDLGPNVTTLGERVFMGCASLSSIGVKDKLETVGKEAFKDCILLGGISFSAAPLTTIGEGAFSGCTSFTSITITGSVTEIGENAFLNCSTALTIYAPSGSYGETYAVENFIRYSSN